MPAGWPGGTGDDVVARLPHDRVVVGQHAEVVRCRAAVDVDVVHVRGVAGRGQRGGVVVGVLRGGHALGRADAGDVLGGQDEHVAADVVRDRVGERLAADRALPGLDPGEPDLDRVTRTRCR